MVVFNTQFRSKYHKFRAAFVRWCHSCGRFFVSVGWHKCKSMTMTYFWKWFHSETNTMNIQNQKDIDKNKYQKWNWYLYCFSDVTMSCLFFSLISVLSYFYWNNRFVSFFCKKKNFKLSVDTEHAKSIRCYKAIQYYIFVNRNSD